MATSPSRPATQVRTSLAQIQREAVAELAFAGIPQARIAREIGATRRSLQRYMEGARIKWTRVQKPTQAQQDGYERILGKWRKTQTAKTLDFYLSVMKAASDAGGDAARKVRKKSA